MQKVSKYYYQHFGQEFFKHEINILITFANTVRFFVVVCFGCLCLQRIYLLPSGVWRLIGNLLNTFIWNWHKHSQLCFQSRAKHLDLCISLNAAC